MTDRIVALRVVVVVACALALNSPGWAACETLGFELSGSQEVPPSPSTGVGWGNLTLHPLTGVVTLTGSFSGLTTNSIAAHIHLAPPGVNGPIILPLSGTGGTSGTLSGSGTLTPSHVSAMLAGNTYVNVHSTMFPGGEIRGQITEVPIRRFGLEGDQEVPPNPSTAIGSGVVLLYDSGHVTLTGSFSGLTTTATAAHIHQAAPGVNGPIIVPLTETGGTSGTLSGSANLTRAQVTALLAGNTYVNVHTTMYPGGEIRGHIIEMEPLEFTLTGSQEVPPNASAAVGSGIVVLHANGALELCGEFAGLTTVAIAAHIHQAPAGVNGPIIVPLTQPAATSGTLSGSAALTPSQMTAMLAGNTYVNVHSAIFPGGEIRGQIVIPPACPADIDGSGGVNVDDLLAVINSWGQPGDTDINGDGTTNVDDLLDVINAWGACP